MIDPYKNQDVYLQQRYDPFSDLGSSFLIPPRNKNDDNSIGIIKALSPKNVLEQIRHQLCGEYWEEGEKKWSKIPYYEPLMNEKGIAFILRILSSHLTDVVTFSSYKEEDIYPVVSNIMHSIIPTLYINYKDFGITNKTYLPIISNEIFVLVYSAFRKSLGAGDRGVIGRTITEEIKGVNPMTFQNQERDGFLSRLNPFRKR